MINKPQKTINRELSWLSFNHRVLQEAIDKNVPLIERLRFLGIFSNNLDEFFKVRVATIKRMIDIQDGKQRVEGIKPKRLMNKIQKKALEIQSLFEVTFNNLIKELETQNIYLLNEKELNSEQETFVEQYFKEKVRSVISPIMLHSDHNFPYLKDRSIYLAIKLSNSEKAGLKEFALIETPTGILPRFIELPGNSNKKYLILLEDIIRHSLKDIFSIFDFNQFEGWIIKMTRDAELDMDNDVSQSFLEKMSKSILGRKTGQPVRFLFDSSISKDLLDFIINKINLDKNNNLIPGARYHNIKDFIDFPNIGGKELVYPTQTPLSHPDVEDGKSIIALMRQKDFMLHVPYQDFNIFISLLQEASIDQNVKEISITIYRVARNSKVMNALINACRNGKKVTVVIELQARFDEESNIYWSRKLEEEGANIHFGIPNLKVHAKLLNIVRIEENKDINYSCVSTGNFHEGNAKIYADEILFTSDKRITTEVSKVFDFFEHTYRNQNYKHLIVSPLSMRRKLYRYIDKEIKNAKAGIEAYITLKINNLVDEDIINKLYEANDAGVKIDLNIRGVCSIIPGIPGKSENISAISIIDRQLEHSRIIVFCNGGNEIYFITSADWMGRNLDRRIEIACPIYDKNIQQEIKNMLNIQRSDNVKARKIDKDQTNTYIENTNKERIQSQLMLYKHYKEMLQNSSNEQQ